MTHLLQARVRCPIWLGGVVLCVLWSMPTRSQEAKPAFSGAPMSMNFQNIDMRTALQIVGDFTGLNIITSDSVTGSLTLKLHQVPWDQVLDIMAQAKGLSVRRQGNVIWVAPRAEVAARDKLEYESKLAAQNLEPMQTRGFALNYAKAVDVLTQIQGGTVLPAMGSFGGFGGLGGLGNTGLGYVPPANSAPFSLSSMGGGSRILSTRGSAMAEVRTNPRFIELHQAVWDVLREEVLKGYQQQLAA